MPDEGKTGNILSISDGTYTTSYVYDSANQLLRENNEELGFTKTWAYDNSGNILYRREYAYTTGSVENLNPVDEVEYLYEHEDLRDMLTEYDGVTITHDAIGNPLNDGQWTYTWEHGRELAAMSDGGYSNWTFAYDANGMRTRRTHSDIEYQYVYNGSQLTQLTVLETGSGELATNTLYFTYSVDGTPLTVTSEGEIYFYVTNIQGDVIAILDDAGRVVCRYIYDAWGNVTTDSWLGDIVADHNPLRYRGYVYDWETELYYLQSRYYSPEIGRFLNADAYAYASTGQGILGHNLFAYCLNSPVNKVDYGGNKPGDLFDTMDEAAIDAAIYLGELSFENCWEYSATIYMVKHIKLTVKIITVEHRFLRWTWTTTKAVVIPTIVTQYTYTEEKTNNNEYWVAPQKAPLFRKPAATIHTHPMGSGKGITEFSDIVDEYGTRSGDIINAINRGIPSYVHGPNGQLKKYNPANETITIFFGLPTSPYTPWVGLGG